MAEPGIEGLGMDRPARSAEDAQAALTGLVFNVQRYSVQDGPGIRTTVFLKGCPLSCAWCHNPEGIRSERELIVVETRCLVCGQCRAACPLATTEPGSGPWVTGDPRCLLCGACVAACPAEARQIVGQPMTVAAVMAQVLRDRVFYDESGGGVTFSGGEPLLQSAFLEALLGACRRRGIRTAVDTSGFAPQERLLRVAALTDLFLYDLKLMDGEAHRRYTGAPIEPILENLRALDAVHPAIWIRIPLIPGITDTQGNLEATAAFVAGLKHVRQICLLPYHRLGEQKANRLRSPGAAFDPSVPAPDQLDQAEAVFQSFGLSARRGG